MNHIADIAEGNHLAFLEGIAHAGGQVVQIVGEHIHPALAVAFACGPRIDFGHHTDHAGNIARLGLGAAHTAQSGRNEQHGFIRRLSEAFAYDTLGVEQGDGGAVDNTLGADVHITARRHLAVLGNAQGVVAVVVVQGGVIGYHHAVGYHHARGVFVRGEQSQRMARIHHQGLLISHFREVTHGEQILGPVLEYGTVAAVGNQFMRMLGHARVQIVLYHQHNGRRLACAGRIFVDGAGKHGIIGSEAVHINPAVGFKFVAKFGRQHLVPLGREIAKRIAHGQFFFFAGKDIASGRCMVDVGIVGFGFGECIGNALAYLSLEIVHGG